MVVAGDLVAHDLARVSGGVVHVDRSDLPGLVADSCQDYLLDAEDPGLLQDRGNVLPRVRSVPVLDAEHEAELGDVRHDDISHLAELAHPGGEVRAEDGVELPLVGHDRVHVDPGPLLGEVREEPLDYVDLLEGPEEAGVEGVELYAQGLPVLVDGDHILGEVAVREAGESARVRGEHGRGESGAFDAHGRDDRKRDGQGAPADAGNVMDRENPFLVHGPAMTLSIHISAPLVRDIRL